MKKFSKLYVQFQRKLGNKSQNLPYCSLLESVIVYNITEIESIFPVPFWDYVADCLWLRDMVSIFWWGKVNRSDSSVKDFFLDWFIFLLYLLQFICCSIYSAKTTNFLFWNLFLHFLHLLVLKHLRIFVIVIQSNFTAFYLKFSRKFY